MELTALSAALAAEIRAERARQQLTQEQVFEPAGMSKSAYLRIETGQRGANVAQLAHIADALGLPLSDLVARAESRLAN